MWSLLDLLDSTVQCVEKIFLVVEVDTFAGLVHSFYYIMKYSEHTCLGVFLIQIGVKNISCLHSDNVII